jgi:two-component system response regulator YesN
MWTLLIADDERTIREGIANCVDWSSLGISRVLLAADGREAYEMIVRERPDIAIVDIVMPEMTGIDVISSFGDEDGSPEFVIVSGYGEFDYAKEAIKHNVKDYILKPCDALEIEATVRAIVARIERRRSMETERLHLRQYVDSLVPHAQEQALCDYLTGVSDGDAGQFSEVFGESCQELRLLLLSLDNPDSLQSLPALRKLLEGAPALQGRRFCATVCDCIVLIFDARSETDVKGIVRYVCQMAARVSITGVRAAISASGCIHDLRMLYRQAYEALRRCPLGESGRGTVDDAPLIDATISRYSKPVRQMIEYVSEHLDDSSLSLARIASDVLYLNPDYLGRLFRKECGVRFSDYLTKVRMEKAKQIIARSADLRVYEVAQKVGLGNNVAYFGQVFRKHTGMRPSEFRARSVGIADTEGRANPR